MPPSIEASQPTAMRLSLIGSRAALHRAAQPPLALSRFDAALLAVLALDGATSRQRLLQLLWPDQEPESARNALRQRLFRLRRSVGADVVHGSEHLALADAVAHDIDRDGVSGELLGGYDYVDCPELQEWLDAQRRAMQARRRTHVVERIAACERDGRHAEGAALVEHWVATEPLHEPALRQLMKLHYLAGHGAAALAAYDRFVSALAAEHPRAKPARETTELLQTIRDARVPQPALRREIPASVLRPPRLVGRDDALQTLSAAWSGGRAFWLLGEAGLGKSRLMAEFVGDASVGVGAAAVLVVAARPGDGGVPYASLGRALRALVERRPALLERAERGELARVMPELEVAATARVVVAAQMVLQHAIRALLTDAQRGGLCALVFDDLHFADTASLEMLQALACDDSLAALRWGFAQRSAEGANAIDALRAALEESQRVDVLALAPLDETQMGELIGSLGLAGLDARQLATPLTRHTGGNPMYALETLKHLITSGQSLRGALPRPAGVAQLIERRLKQLTPTALALARVAAVAGVDFRIELAQSVLATRALALADAWHELEAAQVLRGSAFAHDLVHEATLAGVPAPIAAHTHGEVAAFLEANGGEPARVAAHWIAGRRPQRALASLHAAADAAKRAMRRKEEAAFLERAAQIESEAGDQDAAFESWRAVILATSVANLKAPTAAMFDQLQAAATSARQRGIALGMRAGWLQECGDLQQAKRLAREAIEQADAAGDEPTAARARQHLALILDWEGDYDASLALLQPLLAWAAEHASERERAEFYCQYGAALDNIDRGRDARTYHQRALAVVRKAEAWDDAVIVLGNLAISWASAGHKTRAIELLREALQLAAAHDEARGSATALPAEMYKALRDCGRYDEALRWLEPAQVSEPGLRSVMLQCHAAWGWMHLGQHARAQREIDAALKTAAPAWAHARALQMRARLGLVLGQRGVGALLDEALAIMRPLQGRRVLRASVTLDHAQLLDPLAALAAARAVIAEAERLDLPGTTLAGHLRAAGFAVDAQRAADALAHARAALAVDGDVMPNDLYPAERWLQPWRALRLAGADADAAEALRRGADWVHTTLRDHVPEPFRDSFVRANPVNQQIVRAAQTLT